MIIIYSILMSVGVCFLMAGYLSQLGAILVMIAEGFLFYKFFETYEIS